MSKKQSSKYLLVKEPYKNIWLDTKRRAEEFEYIEIIQKDIPALTSSGYRLMDKYLCRNSLDEEGEEFLGVLKHTSYELR